MWIGSLPPSKNRLGDCMQHKLDICVPSSITVREAMKRLDEAEPKILFVLEGQKLLASLTDGDIRRYLLAGGRLEDPVLAAGNPQPRLACDVNEARELYHEKNYKAIPIVDAAGLLKDIFYSREHPAEKEKALHVPVVINAGGRGTRLEPFTKVLPKPLIPVGELPIVEHIMQAYQRFACDEFHIIVNYKKQLIKAYFAECRNQYGISWYEEEEPLGTGGGLSLLKGKLKESFFFTNCDILLRSDYESMLRFHRENKNRITMICACKNLTIPYGVIEMGKNGCIEAMREKPELSFLTNTGMYLVEPEVLEDIPDGLSISFPEIMEQQRRKGYRVAAYPVSESEWMDMGQLSELEKMRVKLYGE